MQYANKLHLSYLDKSPGSLTNHLNHKREHDQGIKFSSIPTSNTQCRLGA